MEASGVGTDPKFGHVHVLRRMSDSMRAEAAVGKVPHIWRDHDYPAYASAETNKDEIDMTISNTMPDAGTAIDEMTGTSSRPSYVRTSPPRQRLWRMARSTGSGARGCVRGSTLTRSGGGITAEGTRA